MRKIYNPHMAKKNGGSAHDRAVAKSSQEQKSPKLSPDTLDALSAVKKGSQKKDGKLKSFFSKGWVQTTILSAVFLILALPATDFYTWFKAWVFPPIKVTPSEITYGVTAPGAVNAFSDSYNLKITNTTDQNVYNVFVKLLADSTTASIYNFALTIEQDGLKPMDPDTPYGQNVGDVLDMGCFDPSNRAVFIFLLPHMEPNGHRELNLTYRNADYNNATISPKPGTLTVPDPAHGFVVRSQIVSFTKEQPPTYKSANGELSLFSPLKENLNLKCAPPTLTALPSNPMNNHPAP
jgi:hypothetical protein